MEQPWFRNPLHLFAKNKVLIFWPLARQSPVERLNAATRFILYTTAILYIINHDIRVLYLGLTVIMVMASMFLAGGVKEGMRPASFEDEGVHYNANTPGQKCTQPTKDNPMANVLLSDYVDNPKRPAACYYPTVKDKVKEFLNDGTPTDQADVYSSRNQAFRAFYSMPSTTIPNDQSGFAKAAYGPVVDKVCRSDDGSCYPNDGSMFGQSRMPELQQLRGTFGSGVKAST
jgi:hypothetical protein